MNIEYRIIVTKYDNSLCESYEVERLDNESDNEYEKRAFEEYQKDIKEEVPDEWLELRQYDLDEDDYLDWDMTESKYYGGLEE